MDDPALLPNISTETTPGFISRQVRASRLFFLDLDPGAAEKFTVVCGGFESCAPDYRIDRPDFPWLSMEFVAEGAGKIRLGEDESDLGPGVCFTYGPGIPHRITTDPERPLQKYFVDFTGREALALMEEIDFKPGSVFQTRHGLEIRQAFDRLIDRGGRRTRLTPWLCATITTQLLLVSREDALPPGSAGSRAFTTYADVRAVIEKEWRDLHSLEEIAARSGLDPAYLCRLFARFQNESPYQFLTRLKMEEAARLLIDGPATVRQVAHSLGFSDPFHFSRVFKSVHRVPPSRFVQRKRAP